MALAWLGSFLPVLFRLETTVQAAYWHEAYVLEGEMDRFRVAKATRLPFIDVYYAFCFFSFFLYFFFFSLFTWYDDLMTLLLQKCALLVCWT